MRIHLATVIGRKVPVLGQMLRHYRSLGIESFYINVLLSDSNDPVLAEILSITREFGVRIESITIGDWQKLQRGVWRRTMSLHPNEWFLLADQDEFQVYPGPLAEILLECERAGYDYLTGCQLDRLSQDGGFPKVRQDASLWAQFPLVSIITPMLQGGNPRKVVAAKGWVNLVQGQHLAVDGRRCPPEKYFIPVHHFKWVEGIEMEMRRRSRLLREANIPFWVESERFVRYLAKRGGKIDLEDPRFLAAPGRPHYQHWNQVVETFGMEWPECDPAWR